MMVAIRTQRNTSKGLSKEDSFLYSYLKISKTPVSVILTDKRKIIGKIDGINREHKVIIIGGKAIEVVSIRKMTILNKKLNKNLVGAMKDLFHIKYFDRFRGKTIWIDLLDGKREKAKFIDNQKYQIFTENKGTLVIYYKHYISTFAFIEPYPEKFIEYTEETEKVLPGKWREEYPYIQEVWNEELNEKNIYKVEVALKDGRNIKGYLKKNLIFPSNIRMFESSKLKGKSIFIMNHSIADILDISRV